MGMPRQRGETRVTRGAGRWVDSALGIALGLMLGLVFDSVPVGLILGAVLGLLVAAIGPVHESSGH